MHVAFNETSWKVTWSDRIYIWSVLRLSEEAILLGPPFPTFPLACYLWDSEPNTFTTIYSSSDQSMLSTKAQGLIDNFRPLSLQLLLLLRRWNHHIVWKTHIYICVCVCVCIKVLAKHSFFSKLLSNRFYQIPSF